MTPNQYYGIRDLSRTEHFWPLVVVSALLHAGLFWGFSRFQFRSSHTWPSPSVAFVELSGPGLSPRSDNRARAEESAQPLPPAEPSKPATAAKRAAASAQEPEPAPPAAPKPDVDAKQIPKSVPQAADKASPLKASKPQEAESPDEHVAKVIAKLKEGRAPSPDDAVAEKISKLREKRGEATEAEIAEKIGRLRERRIQGSEAQVAHRIEAIRDKYGTREPSRSQNRDEKGGAAGPVGVQGSGAQGVAGFIEGRYLQEVIIHLTRCWSIPEALKGKGYKASVTVIVDRRGTITEWAMQRSGNRLFDERVESAIAEAVPLPPVPNSLSGQRFEYEIRFSAP